MRMQPRELPCGSSVSWEDLPCPDLHQFNLQRDKNDLMSFFSKPYWMLTKVHTAILETALLQTHDLYKS